MIEAGLRRQIIRYAISGGGLTLFYSAVYWIAAQLMHVPVLLANSIAFLLTFGIGWVVHSRWSFAGHGARERPLAGYAKFLAVNIAGYLLNSFWVWLIVDRLHQSVSLPLIPIAFVTPWVSFWLNRRWTFQ